MLSELCDRTLETLMDARKHYLDGDTKGYEIRLQDARDLMVEIAGLESRQVRDDPGESASRASLELYMIRGEYALTASFRYIKQPALLIPLYQEAVERVARIAVSRTVDGRMPYLPLAAYEDLAGFYGVAPEQSDAFIRELERAASLYDRATGGGAGATVLLYRAWMMLLKDRKTEAGDLAARAKTAALLAGQEWMVPYVERFLSWVNENSGSGQIRHMEMMRQAEATRS